MKADFVFALENAAWPVLILNDSGVIYRANPAAAETLSAVTETGRLAASSIWSPENEATLEAFLARASRADGLPVKLRMKNGQTGLFSACTATFSRDGQKNYLVQLLKLPPTGPSPASPISAAAPGPAGEDGVAQKLECALQLTRTVALDFNNALTAILGHTSLLLGNADPNHPWHASLAEVEKAAEKAAEIAADLAAFSRQETEGQPPPSGNLNQLVRTVVDLFQRAGTKSLTWSLELEPKLFVASFDEAKMQQALIKILDNAVQAANEGGRVFVRTRNLAGPGEIEDAEVRLPAGHYVCIEIEDTGPGIPTEILPRVFEPFFTTKKSPEHRGLGLAWVYGIVTNHGGRVSVSSPPGRGAIVRVYLPAEKRIVRERVWPIEELRGTETILMVDDEELLLTMGEMVLSSFGYRVLTANSGAKALDLFRDNANQIDLVFTDLVMPQMSGRELIRELKRLSPHVRIICSSGYSLAGPGGDQELYLKKPFTSLELLRKARQALSVPDVS